MSAIQFPLAAGAGRLPAALRRFLEQECFILLVLAPTCALLAYAVPTLVVQDTWLALVDGRAVAQHGLPRVDALTVIAHGMRWVDQQWLAHLTFYELDRIGGLRFTLAACLGLTFLALALAARFARGAGGSARSVALFAAAPICIAPWLLQLRTQTLALPLFVAVYGLLAADSRRPSARVWLTLALLVVWANLHGSAVVGVLLVCAHGLLLVVRRRHVLRGLLLTAAAPATVVVSPYGLATIGYYRGMLIGSPMRKYVLEWQPTTLGITTALFFASALAMVFALGRHGRALSVFERAALPLLILLGLGAGRSGAWFALATAVSAPLLLDAWHPPRPLPAAAAKINRRLATAVLALATVVVAGSFARPAASFESRWPAAGARAVAAAAGAHGLVYADDVHSDWLLWKEPQLAGRIAYDVRFELLSAHRLAQVAAFKEGEGSGRIAAPYRVLTFAGAKRARPWRQGTQVAYASPDFVVLSR